MEQQFEPQNYREILKKEFEERCKRNASYSLRSFARDLGIAPGRLSDVLRGRYGISVDAAKQIASKLGYSNDECTTFCDLVESQHSRKSVRKLAAQNRVAARKVNYQELSADAFRVVSDWYHYAILELTLLENFDLSVDAIADRLKINRNLVRPAIERLEKLRLLKFLDGSWVATDGFTASPNEIPSEAIKKFHQQVLERALAALYCQDVRDRDFSSMVMAIDARDLPAAKEQIKEFRRGFDQKFGKSETKNSVYCLSTQFFRLDGKE